MGTACPARPLREKFSSGWHYLQWLLGGGGSEAAGPGLVTGRGPGRRRGGDLGGPGSACAIPGVRVRTCPARGPGCEFPDPAGFLVRGYPTLRAPVRRTLTPGMQVRGPPRPCLRRRTPMHAPGELRSNLTKLAAGCAGLYLDVGRGPGSPALSRRALQAVPPPPRAAPPAGPAPPPREGGAATPPVQPRPSGLPRGPRPKALAAE